MYSHSGTNVWDRPAAKQPIVESAWVRPLATTPVGGIETAMRAVGIDESGPNACEMRVEMGRLRAVVDGLRERTEKMQAELYENERRFKGMQQEIDQLRFAVNSRPVGSASGYASAGPSTR